MAIKENLNTLAQQYQGRIGPTLSKGSNPDIDQIIETIMEIQEALLEDILSKILEDSLAATSSIAIAWFFMGLLYSHEYGTPSEVIRTFES